MPEKILIFLFLVGMSLFCWAMVFYPSTRRKFNLSGRSWWWHLDKEGREAWDAAQLASYIIGGTFFSVITLFFLFFGIYQSLAR